MAEFVHRNTEEMINELEQLQRTKLFSRLEIKAIIKKRLRHEYKLVRIQRQKQDFLAYIQYEINLLDLIQQRRKAIQYYFKKDEIEFAIITRIHRIFKRATFLWSADLKMWISHAQFCKRWNKSTQLSKICTHMLQIHGNKPQLWILAAKWKLEVCKSMDSCRAIFMKGIKRHPTHKKLWVEFFRAELMFAQKIHMRMKALASVDINIDDMTDKEAKLMQGGAALIVYRNACASIPDKPEFYVEFLKIASCFLSSSPFAIAIIRDMEYYLKSAFSSVPIVRSEMAKLRLNLYYGDFRDKGFAHKKMLQRVCDKRCFDIYEEAVKEIDSEDMWEHYLQCLFELCQQVDFTQRSVLGEAVDTENRHRIDHTVDVVTRAHNKRKVPACIYPTCVDFLVKSVGAERAYIMISEICSDSVCPTLWVKKLELFLLVSSMNIIESTKTEAEDLFQGVLKTLTSMTIKQEKKFWQLWMEYAISNNDRVMADELVVKHSLKSNPKATSDMLRTYLNWLVSFDGVKAAYDVFTQTLCSVRSPCLELFQFIIDVCQSLSYNDLTRSLFDSALRKHGKHSVDLWLSYIKHCRQTGKASDVGSVFWRAKTSLDPSLIQKFFTQFSLLDSSCMTERVLKTEGY